MHPTVNQGTQHHTHDLSLPSITTQAPATKPLTHSSLRATGDHEAEGSPQTHPDPLTMVPRWALCPLGWQAHAIDPWADHPRGVWIARCGYQLSGSTSLHDDPPGQPCPACSRWSPTTETGAEQ